MSEPHIDALEKPPVSIWKRLFLVSGVFVVLLVALSIGQRYLHSSHIRGHMAQLQADLDESDPSWRLEEIELARSGLPDEQNSALVVRAAHRLVRKGLPDYKVMERFDKLPPLPELLDAEGADVLEKQMAPLAAALAEARKLADMPRGQYTITHDVNPIATLLPHAQEARNLARLLHYDALNLAQKDRIGESLRSCQAALNTGRSFGDEPFIISQLCRTACVGVAAGAAERTLALGQAPAGDLARLQALVELEEAHPTSVVALRGERAQLHILLNGLANGSIPVEGILDSGKIDWTDRLALWDIKGMARREQPKIMEFMTRAIDVARLPAHEQAAAEMALGEELRHLVRQSYLLRMLTPAMDKCNAAFRRKLAQMRCLMTVLAVERYRLEKDAWPVKLEELTPKLLKKVPLDPFDGKPLRYLRVADGVIVYSVGADGKDDGGNIDRTNPVMPGTDIGFQLWDVKHRRQPANKK
jgi:hypothetical protein